MEEQNASSESAESGSEYESEEEQTVGATGSERESSGGEETVGDTGSERESSGEENGESSGDDSSDVDEENNERDENIENGIPARTRGGYRRGGIRGGRGRGNARTRGGPKKPIIEWSTWDSAPFVPSNPPFLGDPGPQVELPDTVLEFVQLYLTDEFMEEITFQTNLYARQFIIANPGNHASKVWKPVDPDELMTYLAISVLMGISTRPKVKDYWSKDPLYHNPLINAVMSRNRYEIINKFLHFADNSQYNNQDPNRDRLYKVRPVLDHLVSKFQELYYPTREVSVDEQLLKFKGQLYFKQYIPKKRSRFGVKFFSLCDSNGYLFNTNIYVGSETIHEDPNAEGTSKTAKTVMKMVEPILDMGHHLYTDNWFNSPGLTKDLLVHDTLMCGTIRRDRGKFPAEFLNKRMKRGDTSFLSNGENILALRYKDKKDVFFISSIHRPKKSTAPKHDREGNPILREQVVLDYNSNMGNVDKNDSVVVQHTMVRKCSKWTTKVAFHLFEEALFNAHVLYGFSNLTKLSFTDFKREFLKQVFQKSTSLNVFATNSIGDQHFLTKVPPTNPKYPNAMKRCRACHKKARDQSRDICVTLVLVTPASAWTVASKNIIEQHKRKPTERCTMISIIFLFVNIAF